MFPPFIADSASKDWSGFSSVRFAYYGEEVLIGLYGMNNINWV
jgi:hypothetical protein